jgi:hypothetical protein
MTRIVMIGICCYPFLGPHKKNAKRSKKLLKENKNKI